MRTTPRSWALLASVSGVLLGGSIGCIVVAALALTPPSTDAGILSTSEISRQMECPVTIRQGVMTERLRTGVMTDRVRNDRVAIVTPASF